jgi:hypothetical protein
VAADDESVATGWSVLDSLSDEEADGLRLGAFGKVIDRYLLGLAYTLFELHLQKGDFVSAALLEEVDNTYPVLKCCILERERTQCSFYHIDILIVEVFEIMAQEVAYQGVLCSLGLRLGLRLIALLASSER